MAKKAAKKSKPATAPEDSVTPVTSSKSFSKGLTDFFLNLVIIAVVAGVAVMLFRPIDTTRYFNCGGDNGKYTPSKTYYRSLLGDTEAYYEAVGDSPSYSLLPNTPVPPGCSVHSFSLYLF